MGWLEKFVAESNKIEGIIRAPSNGEISAHQMILGLDRIEIEHLQEFVSQIAPRHVLRDRDGLDVYVGSHVPPPGGPAVRTSLSLLLQEMNGDAELFLAHQRYETLHPFTDGNGRSGRVLWLYGMEKSHQLNRVMKLGFLHNWYYQSLENFQEA